MTVLVCQKCDARSGDDWSQCQGKCPVKGSPHFDEQTLAIYGPLLSLDVSKEQRK